MFFPQLIFHLIETCIRINQNRKKLFFNEYLVKAVANEFVNK